MPTKKKKITAKKKKKRAATPKKKKKVPMGTKDLGNGFSATIYPPSINYKIEW